LSGISRSETLGCNENGYYSIYQSDRYGFNNPDYEWDEKKIDYILIGDSFTHGACVNRPHDIASNLRKLSKKSVLNLGHGWIGPVIEYAILREYLKTNVKKVIWIYYEGNDLIDLENEKKDFILQKYLANSKFTQNLILKQIEIDNFLKNYIKEKTVINTFYIPDFYKLRNTRLIISSFFKSKSSVEFTKIIKQANELIIENKSKLYFVYLPSYDRFNLNYYNPDYNMVKKIINELGITFIDMKTEVFDKQKNPLKLFPFEMSGHYNIEGYKKISEVIYKFTKN